jgi:hypothetical protein
MLECCATIFDSLDSNESLPTYMPSKSKTGDETANCELRHGFPPIPYQCNANNNGRWCVDLSCSSIEIWIGGGGRRSSVWWISFRVWCVALAGRKSTVLSCFVSFQLQTVAYNHRSSLASCCVSAFFGFLIQEKNRTIQSSSYPYHIQRQCL